MAQNDLNVAQAQLDAKQAELDEVQAQYDKAVQEKQVKVRANLMTLLAFISLITRHFVAPILARRMLRSDCVSENGEGPRS